MINSSIKQIRQYTLPLITLLMLNACTTTTDVPIGQSESAWDFDHKLQFLKTKLDDNHYRLEVITNKKVKFSRATAFLFRKSYLICGGYSFTLRPVKGIESFDQKRASPHLIRSNVVVNIECDNS